MSDPTQQPGLDQPGLERPGGGTSTLLEREVDATPRTSHGDGDHERFAHYVKKEKILESALSGEKVTALCGKKWIPTRDPNRFPVCPACKEIFSSMPPGGGDGDDSDKGGAGS
jgi:DUF3039 family protein